MPRPAARIQLSAEEESTLREWTRKGTSEQRVVERARIILLSHEGLSAEKISERLQTRTARVSKWRQRFAEGRLNALGDALRPGKPRTYSDDTERRVLRLLDQSPPDGYGQWNGRLLAAALGDVSADQVWRILRKHQIQLQRRRSWCISTDPEFGPKAADVVGLYLNPPENALVCRSMRSRTFRLWSGPRDTFGCPMERRSTASAIATSAMAQPLCSPPSMC